MQHNYRWEAESAAKLGSIQSQPIPNQPDSTLNLKDIESNIKVNDPHFAISQLLSLEITIGGKILSASYMHEAVSLARKHGLNCHLDSVRTFSAIKGLNVSLSQSVENYDSVSLCLSKGLGEPIGSVFVGDRKLREVRGESEKCWVVACGRLENW